MPPYKAKPRLNVQSDYLVYLWNVPEKMKGGELKRKLDDNFGLVRFIETFEAWHFKPIGHMVVEFGNYAAMELFLEMMVAERVPFLQPPIECKGLLNLGRREFFQLIYEKTEVDLLRCNGQPPSMDWNKQRASGAVMRSVLGYNTHPAVRAPARSPFWMDDDIGPFLCASTSSGGGVRRDMPRGRAGYPYGGGGASDGRGPRTYRLY